MDQQSAEDNAKSDVVIEDRPKIVDKQPKLSNFTIKTDQRMKNELDLLVGEFFYACNIPFSVAEHPAFKCLLETLRPGYKGPNRKNLGGDILNVIYEKCLTKNKKFLDGKSATLVQDGWSSNHNDPVIASCISVEGNIVYMSSVYTGDNKKTSDYCKQLAEDSILQAENDFNCQIKSFVSDNENKMKKARNDLQIAHADDNFISYGCAAHYLNLAGQDITSKAGVNSIIKQVVEVQKYFRNHHKPGL